MKKSGIIVLGTIFGVIALYAVLQTNTENIVPIITDKTEIGEKVSVDLKDTILENKVSQVNEDEYYIDDEGVKHYVISAVDNPNIGE